MIREMLSSGNGLRLDLVQPETGDGPFSFQTICLGCLQLVAMTTYTPADQEDPTMETRIDQDSAQDLRDAQVHQLTCAGSAMGGRS